MKAVREVSSDEDTILFSVSFHKKKRASSDEESKPLTVSSHKERYYLSNPIGKNRRFRKRLLKLKHISTVPANKVEVPKKPPVRKMKRRKHEKSSA